MRRFPEFGEVGAGGLKGSIPTDVWLLLAVVFSLFSLQFFDATRWLPDALKLTPLAWKQAKVWQLATYPFVGTGLPGLWFLIELLILMMFAKDLALSLGRRGFWTLIVGVSAIAGLLACVAYGLQFAVTGGPSGSAFQLMQGQRMLLTIAIAGFATLNGESTILLFFVLPIKAKWFLGLELAFAILGFLGSMDLAGFIGLCGAVGCCYLWLTAGRGNNPRGFSSWRRELALRLQREWFRLRLQWLRRRRGLRVVRPETDSDRDDPWVH